MDEVERQYETFPYPARDPADEATRLIQGSPSHPVEVDQYLFRGKRDWSQPFRVLTAGGGTGDSLVMLAQVLSDIGCPAEITYLDRSSASRAIAEARMAARGLSATFVTADLSEAAAMGPFDYIDCVGVLHHLPDPDAGFATLAACLAPGGGIGLAVYAPHGRTGVYPMQQALRALVGDDDPADQVTLAKAVLAATPETNWTGKNTVVGDHRRSDAGLYDLLLHSRDIAYEIGDLAAALDRAGLGIVSMLAPSRYDPLTYLPDNPALRRRAEALPPIERMALAERLVGNIKLHIAYVARTDETEDRIGLPAPDQIPHLANISGGQMATHVARSEGFAINIEGLQHRVGLDRRSAPVISFIDGKRTLAEIATAARLDPARFEKTWEPVDRLLRGFNFLHYSQGARR